jgi:hypothetical protein
MSRWDISTGVNECSEWPFPQLRRKARAMCGAELDPHQRERIERESQGGPSAPGSAKEPKRTQPLRRYLGGKLAGGVAFAALAAGALLLVAQEPENTRKVSVALQLDAQEPPPAEPAAIPWTGLFAPETRAFIPATQCRDHQRPKRRRLNPKGEVSTQNSWPCTKRTAKTVDLMSSSADGSAVLNPSLSRSSSGLAENQSGHAPLRRP